MVTPCVDASDCKSSCQGPDSHGESRDGPPLDHAAGQEAADRNPGCPFYRPHHGPAGAIWHGDDSIVGHVDPLALEPDAIMTVLRFPIDVGNGGAIGVRTA